VEKFRSGIWDKHPGSATRLLERFMKENCVCWLGARRVYSAERAKDHQLPALTHQETAERQVS
jgi:hypothetical protein